MDSSFRAKRGIAIVPTEGFLYGVQARDRARPEEARLSRSLGRQVAYVCAICSCSSARVTSRSTSSGMSDSMIVGLNAFIRSITFARR